MKTRNVFLFSLILLTNKGLQASDISLPPSSKTDQIIVNYHPVPTAANALAFIKHGVTHGAFGVAAGKRKDVLEIGAHLSIEDVDYLANGLTDDPQVAYAEPDFTMRALQVPNDPRYNEQWHYFEATAGINLPAAWDITTGSENITIAVIDTGILSHVDLQPNLLAGYDFISDAWTANDGGGRDSNPTDTGDALQLGDCPSTDDQIVPAQPTPSSWHGTHVAGTIAAASNNGTGVTGIAWNSKILPLRVLGRCGGYSSDIIDAMRWAAGLSVYRMPVNLTPAKVINLSLGGAATGCPRSYQDAIDDITAAGVTVVVAAGNSNDNVSNSIPANCNNIISVAAINRYGDRSWYSNYGSSIDLAAPGGNIYFSGNGVLSTLNTGLTTASQDSYQYYQGTSMAAPHVAGVAALIYALRPDITPSRLEQLMKSAARNFGGSSSCSSVNCGAGILDAAAVLRAVQNEPQ